MYGGCQSSAAAAGSTPGLGPLLHVIPPLFTQFPVYSSAVLYNEGQKAQKHYSKKKEHPKAKPKKYLLYAKNNQISNNSEIDAVFHCVVLLSLPLCFTEVGADIRSRGKETGDDVYLTELLRFAHV